MWIESGIAFANAARSVGVAGGANVKGGKKFAALVMIASPSCQ